MTGTAPRLRSLAVAALLTTGLGLAGCSSSGSDESAGATASVAEDAPEEGAAQGRDSAGDLAAFDADAESLGDVTSAQRANPVAETPAPQLTQPGEQAIISVGTITLQSDDVATARFDLEKVADSLGGTIADEKTTATAEGEVQLSRVVLRIPSDDFDTAMIELAKLGKVTASTRKAEDVTGQVIDTQARIRAQEQSLERVEVLFARAQDIRDIVAIEAQLSRRQAELDSLKGQLAYLQDQTSLSTITVYLEKTPEKAATEPKVEDADNAFVGGLKSGWDALAGLGAGLAVVAGALLPFAVVALVLGVPAVLVGRRLLARHPLRRPTAEA